jgi:serine/threonine protein kinase
MSADPPTIPVIRPDGPFPQEFGRYRLLRRLGGGGMGSVFLAHDGTLDLNVALKMPHPHLLEHPTILERFRREAQAAARLRHPNLCPIFDVGEYRGLHYLTMPYIEGTPLSECLPGDPRQAAELVRTLALAMAEAHCQGVIHRDLKPGNVLITPRGEAVITDFGAALRIDGSEERLTEPGVFLGTPAYMAPEQLQTEQQELGPGCDVYALGVLLYKLLTGTVPFWDRDRDVLRHRVLEEEPPSPVKRRPGLDPRLEAVCLKALAKRAEERFAGMEQFAAALDDCLKGPAAPPPAAGKRPPVRREAVRFAFAGLGERAPAKVPPDRLYLDVGNDLRAGVLDHHHMTADAGSTARLVLSRPDLIDAAVNPDRRPDAPFTLVLHEHPDLDCLASAYLATAYLAARAFPPGAEALARYVGKIDEGGPGFSLANPFALYAASQQLANRLARRPANSNHERWQELMRSGLTVVEYVLEQTERRGQPVPGVDAFACPGVFGPEDRAEVQADMERYRRKLADPRCRARQARLRLPSQFGGLVEVEALLVRDVQNGSDPERVMFFKDWARTDARRCPNGTGFVALSIFHSEGPHQVRRCILSVTPDSGASLKGLGRQLDEAEAQRRREVFGTDDRVTDPTTGTARTARPGYDNADPWYDGRAHGYSIVDSPRSGTLLSADEIEALFLSFGGQGSA